MSALSSTILGFITRDENQLSAGAFGAAAAILATTILWYVLGSKDKDHEFPKLRGIQLYHAWNFFQYRHDFFRLNLKQNLGKNFSFNVLQHNVIALAGEDARRAFFSNHHFAFDEGYKIFFGVPPRISEVDIVPEENKKGNPSLTNKRINKVLDKARMQHILPVLLQDIFNRADKWGNGGKNGRIDPFTEIYYLVLAMTARTVTCHDLTTNEADLKKIGELFMTLQTSATPVSLLLPWFPSPARKTAKQAGADLYATLYTYVETRRHAEPTSDAIDMFIADGETTQNIVGFVMNVLFAGITSTSFVGCWMLIDIAIRPEWRAKCKKEIQDLLSHHLDSSLSSATLHEKLAAIPLSSWEDELPIFEACIQETHRILLTAALLRRNVRGETKIGEQVVRRGDFLAYFLADVNLNPEYYPEPYKYDPGRWLRPDPIPNTTHPFLGWGAGRHRCTGMKMAKLEMKLILALFLTRYEFDIVDEGGKFPDPLPVPDRNDIHKVRVRLVRSV